MATIYPFRALRPVKEHAAAIASVPYDVVTIKEARELAEGNSESFLHVSRAEIDLPDGADPYFHRVYEKAAGNLQKLLSSSALFQDDDPGIYIYSLRMGTHQQAGIAACCSIDEYDRDIIRKHERTRRDKEDDRTRHILSLRAQTGPVFMTYRVREEINQIVDSVVTSEPLYNFTAVDGIEHTIWKAFDLATRELIKAFKNVPLLYIADGHHRAASASRVRTELAANNPNHTGTEDYNFFLSVLFPSNQVCILPYNRIVKDLNGMTPSEFLLKLSEYFSITENPPSAPYKKGNVSIYINGRWYGIGLLDSKGKNDDPISSLDVSLLQCLILDPILSIKDIRTDKRLDYIGGIRGTSALEHAVDSGEAAVAFSMFPVHPEELFRIADCDEIMPPKSTWFEPKLRDGLLSHVI